MYHYHPRKAPDPNLWLSFDEQERIRLVESFHRGERQKLPDIRAHSTFHAIVENQIAEKYDPVVRAMVRLQKEGLTRHDAIHAVAWVLAMQLYEASKADEEPIGEGEDIRSSYEAAIERLDAKSWREQAGGDDDD